MKVRIVMKNGYNFVLECEKFTAIRHAITGELTGYEIEGTKINNRPLYLKIEEIVCIIREE